MTTGHIALILWPLVGIFLFKKLPLQQAIIWTILGGYLMLPTGRTVFWDLPALPPIDKLLVPSLTAAALATLTLRRQAQGSALRKRTGEAAPQSTLTVLKGWVPRSKLGLFLFGLAILSTVMTAQTNGDVQVFGPTVLPALRSYDALSMTVELLIVLLPTLVARKYLSDDAGHRNILIAFCLAALIYSIPALYEVRMSPQINRMVYGFFPHSWQQHIRAGGFRPLVFLDHGLQLGIFFACAILGTATLIRMEVKKRGLYVMALVWLLLSLVMAKTVGALMLAVLFLPVALFFPVRLQLLVAGIVAIVMLSYPILRGGGFVPTQEAVELAASFDEERAQSLEFRFDNEDLLLERANERPLFGWGGFSRGRVFDETTGRDLTVTDGAWIIFIGQGGWLGFIAQFGLMSITLIVFFLRRGKYQVGLATAGLCTLHAANLLDLIPNSSVTAHLWLVTGALLGRLELPLQQSAAAKHGAGRARGQRGRASADQGTDPGDDAATDGLTDPTPAVARSRYSRFAPDKAREAAPSQRPGGGGGGTRRSPKTG